MSEQIDIINLDSEIRQNFIDEINKIDIYSDRLNNINNILSNEYKNFPEGTKNFPQGTTPEGGRSKKFPSETKTPQSHTCPHCAKNKFTSDYQLSIHIKAKH